MSGYGVCQICTKKCAAIHMHHTIPVSCGGRDSTQIPLCGSCHTALHAAASYVVAQLKSTTKRIPKVFWYDLDSTRRAKPYVDVLVTALVNNKAKPTNLPLHLPAPLYALLVRLQRTLGHRSMQQTVQFCISSTAKVQGLLEKGENNG